jgi:tetratricopeptide (TPR) repeat protein
MSVKLPQIETWHFRDHAAEVARKEQRKVQNRVTLLDDWLTRESNHSLFYLASEWREFSKDKSVEYFTKFLEGTSKIGDARYQTRLIVAKEYAIMALEAREKGDHKAFLEKVGLARKILIPATEDNWERTEHWLWLGDLAAEQEMWEEAIQFYKYAHTRVGQPPFVLWWIDSQAYQEWPAQRLSEAYANLGDYASSLHYAREVLAILSEDEESQPLLEETKGIIVQLETELGIAREEIQVEST